MLLAFLAYGPILFNGAGWSGIDDLDASNLKCCGFRPLLALTYQLNSRFGGWMLLNLALHVAVAWMLLYVSKSLIAALIFAVHPMAADAVGSVAGRSGLLVALGVLAGIVIYRRSKPAGLLLGFMALVAAMGFHPSYFGTIHGAPGRLEFTRVYGSALFSYVLPKMFVPLGLSPDPLISQHWAGGFCIFLVMASLAWWKFPRLRLGLGLLVLPLIPFFFVPLTDVFFDHRGYLSLAGAAILMAHALSRTPRAALVIIPALLVMANSRALVYSSPERLWEDAVEKAPMKGRPHVNLGAAYARSGRWYEAEAQLREGVRLAPEFSMGWYDLSTLLILRGNVAESSHVLDMQDMYLRCRYIFPTKG